MSTNSKLKFFMSWSTQSGHSDLFVPVIFLIPIQLFVYHITISLDLYFSVLHKVMGVKPIENVTSSEFIVLMAPNALKRVQKLHKQYLL